MSLEELRVHKRGCGRHPHPSGSTAALLEIPVLAVYPTSAHSLFLAFFAFNEINNLRLISQAQNSDSPRLHHSVDTGLCQSSGSILLCAEHPSISSCAEVLCAQSELITEQRFKFMIIDVA